MQACSVPRGGCCVGLRRFAWSCGGLKKPTDSRVWNYVLKPYLTHNESRQVPALTILPHPGADSLAPARPASRPLAPPNSFRRFPSGSSLLLGEGESQGRWLSRLHSLMEERDKFFGAWRCDFGPRPLIAPSLLGKMRADNPGKVVLGGRSQP